MKPDPHPVYADPVYDSPKTLHSVSTGFIGKECHGIAWHKSAHTPRLLDYGSTQSKRTALVDRKAERAFFFDKCLSEGAMPYGQCLKDPGSRIAGGDVPTYPIFVSVDTSPTATASDPQPLGRQAVRHPCENGACAREEEAAAPSMFYAQERDTIGAKVAKNQIHSRGDWAKSKVPQMPGGIPVADGTLNHGTNVGLVLRGKPFLQQGCVYSAAGGLPLGSPRNLNNTSQSNLESKSMPDVSAKVHATPLPRVALLGSVEQQGQLRHEEEERQRQRRVHDGAADARRRLAAEKSVWDICGRHG